MKRILFIALTVSLLFCHIGNSQTIPDGAKKINESAEIPEGAVMINENTVFKDEEGNKVEFFKFIEMMESGEWSSEPVKDEKGKLQYVQLKKATEEEKIMRGDMPKIGNSSALIGKKAPDFKMKDKDGNQLSLESIKGKVVVLNFWFASCKPCITEIPELNKVYEKYKSDEKVVFASITFEKKDQVNEFLKKYPFSYPIVSDAKEICDLFNVSSFPTNIIIDRNGNYYEYIVGGNPNIGQHLSRAIKNAL